MDLLVRFWSGVCVFVGEGMRRKPFAGELGSPSAAAAGLGCGRVFLFLSL
eukprot:gene12160-8364_t